MAPDRWLALPPPPYILHNCFVPAACLDGEAGAPGSPPVRPTPSLRPDPDSLVHVDIAVDAAGNVASVHPAKPRGGVGGGGVPAVDARCGIVFPAFCDLHTHIGKRREGMVACGGERGVGRGARDRSPLPDPDPVVSSSPRPRQIPHLRALPQRDRLPVRRGPVHRARRRALVGGRR